MKKRAQKKAKKPVIWIEVPEIVVPDELTIEEAAADLVVGVAEAFKAQRELNRLGEGIGSMLSSGTGNESWIIKLSDQYLELAAAAERAGNAAWLFAGVIQRERLAGRIPGPPGIGLRFADTPRAVGARQALRVAGKPPSEKSKKAQLRRKAMLELVPTINAHIRGEHECTPAGRRRREARIKREQAAAQKGKARS